MIGDDATALRVAEDQLRSFGIIERKVFKKKMSIPTLFFSYAGDAARKIDKKDRAR